MQPTIVAVVPTRALTDSAAVIAGTMCGELRFAPDPDDKFTLIRSCGRHGKVWPLGRAMCLEWSDEYAQLWLLARAVAFGQVDVAAPDGRTERGDARDVLAAIAARHAGTTGGPWFWYGDTDSHNVSLAGQQPGAGVTEVLTTVQVERDPTSREAQRLRANFMDVTGCDDDEAARAVSEWAHDADGAPRTDSRLALLDPETTILRTVEELAVFTVARQQGLPDDTGADNPKVYRRSICDVRNANGKFLAASWADVAWLLGQVQQMRNTLDQVEALLPPAGEQRVDERGNFYGLDTSPQDSHRTAGGRAWSDAGTWCYPDSPCPLCQEPVNPHALREALNGKVDQ